MVHTFVELLQAFKLRSETAFGGGVDNQDNLALEVGQRVRLALLVVGLEVVERSRGCHGSV